MSIISFIYKLLFNSKKNVKEDSQAELFHSDDYLRPDTINYRKCPNCSNEAKTNKDVVELFGIRRVKGRPSVQSWCKNCRADKEQSRLRPSDEQEKFDIN